MSSIYIKEPPTEGKAIMITTAGEIEIELWTKECPLACKNFIQHALDGYYNESPFHRLVKNFIIQGGEPVKAVAKKGASIYDKPFKTEPHSRLLFNRRGLLGMASPAKDKNECQFFFTLGPAEELNGFNTLFGKVVGNTVFNMLKLGDKELIGKDKPSHMERIVRIEVIRNPFEGVVPRNLYWKKKEEEKPKDKKEEVKVAKNYKLLSFGDEAEEAEAEFETIAEKERVKGKSYHDLANNPKMVPEKVEIDPENDRKIIEQAQKDQDAEFEERRKRRLQAEKSAKNAKLYHEDIDKIKEEGRQAMEEIKKIKMRELSRLKELNKDKYVDEKRAQDEKINEKLSEQWQSKNKPRHLDSIDDPVEFTLQVASYKNRSIKMNKRKREESTMDLLKNFKGKLTQTLLAGDSEETDKEEAKKFKWMTTKLIGEENEPMRKVLDPNMDHPDRYDISDPRNPINVRRREGVVNRK